MIGRMNVPMYNKEDLQPLFYHDKCDKYDYLLAVGCGAVAGLVDLFLVGTPAENSVLTQWSDAQADRAVQRFARLCGWTPRQGKENSMASAIGFLEKKFPVNYDQRHSGDVGDLFRMSPKNHHLKSLAHSPDVVGLFFSILNQFTSTSSFLDHGQLITISTSTYELQGHNLIAKLFCGVANWFGHIMSDAAGSSGASGRGSGVPIPFFSLFQLCQFGNFKVEENRNTLAVLATKVFQEGYDARFGLTMAIPVLLCDLSIRLIWSIKRYFYHRQPLRECVPNKTHDDLRVMLIMGSGVLCLMDGADAAIRSGGNAVAFFLRLNIFAWFRFALLVLREVCIRAGISFPMQKQLDAYIRINQALTVYLERLRQIDFEQFQKELSLYHHVAIELESANSTDELNQILKRQYEVLGIPMPYKGDFDEWMQDQTNRLVFE